MSKNNLIIGGVYKGGTTSLYTYLSMHPEICVSNKKETEYFHKKDPIYEDYMNFFEHCNGEKILVEASPGYLFDDECILERIKSTLPNNKIIFILRNPIDRFLSDIRHLIKTMNIDSNSTPYDYYLDCIKDLSKDVFPNSLGQGLYINFLKKWYSVYPDNDIKILFFDDLSEDSNSVLFDICDWLKLDDSCYRNLKLGVENKSIGFKNESLQKWAYSIFNRYEGFFRKNYKIKVFLRNIYLLLNKKDLDLDTTDELIKELSQFYQKPNQELKSFLVSHGYKNLPNWL